MGRIVGGFKVTQVTLDVSLYEGGWRFGYALITFTIGIFSGFMVAGFTGLVFVILLFVEW